MQQRLRKSGGQHVELLCALGARFGNVIAPSSAESCVARGTNLPLVLETRELHTVVSVNRIARARREAQCLQEAVMHRALRQGARKPAMRPSEIAALVAAQHRALRTELDELSNVAKTLLAGGPTALERAVDLSRVAHRNLKRGIAMEASLLVPALREADAWGRLRAKELLARLRTRRHAMERLRASYARAERVSLAREIEHFVHVLRGHMGKVEREELSSRVLRDDVLGIDVDGG